MSLLKLSGSIQDLLNVPFTISGRFINASTAKSHDNVPKNFIFLCPKESLSQHNVFFHFRVEICLLALFPLKSLV